MVRAYFPGPPVQLSGVKSKDELIQAPIVELSLSNQKAAVHAFSSENPVIIPFCWSRADYQPKQAVFGPQHAPF